jgi:hypothetical protein
MNAARVWPGALVLMLATLASLSNSSSQDASVSNRVAATQIKLETIEKMPRGPIPFEIRDWRTVARDMDAVLFDFEAKGENLPAIWWDKSHRNFPQDTFALPAYLGDSRQKPTNPERHEAITAIGAVLGASLVGIDKSNQDGQNYAHQLLNYFNKDNGLGIVMNGTNATNGSFWYDLFPNIGFAAVASLYPQDADLERAARASANRWGEAIRVIAAGKPIPNFEVTYFDFKTMQPVDNRQWLEPDAAAGLAWLEYAAYTRWKDPKYLENAQLCMNYLESLPRGKSPLYELLLSYGTLATARMNAELGQKYDLEKMMYWIFDGDSFARGDWAVIGGRWGDQDVYGLHGSVSDFGGYAFAFNTFNLAGSLAPIPRYDARYARAIGRWLLNLANSARLFYPKYLGEDNQIQPEYRGAYRDALAYEGLRKKWGIAAPYGVGDARRFGWASTDFALYGSAYVGMLGGIVGRTSDPSVLEIDLLKTDFLHAKAYPTFLYYNPHDQPRTVQIDVGPGNVNLYDSVTHALVAQNVTGKINLELPADAARVIVRTPVKPLELRDAKTVVDGVIVDYAP